MFTLTTESLLLGVQNGEKQYEKVVPFISGTEPPSEVFSAPLIWFEERDLALLKDAERILIRREKVYGHTQGRADNNILSASPSEPEIENVSAGSRAWEKSSHHSRNYH
ncbi:hypothetical protein TNCV_3925711 [Trichonephila clavipes]|nr:hypothetical protein TNCV_3925711 [Trichonephila clavipes]